MKIFNLFMLGILLSMPQLIFAQSTISGTVTDELNRPLAGASVSLVGSRKGTITDPNGNYSLASDNAFPWTLRVSFVGYSTKTIKINSAGEQDPVILVSGINLGEEVIVTASRIPEKAIEAAASVTTLNSDRLDVTPVNGDPTEYLRNVQGVSVISGGTQSSNIEIRGPVNVLESSTLVLKDYAPLTASSDKILLSAADALSPLDIARIEVVRGPSGALYGPNVTAGVVHFITKDAFKYPGLSVLTTVGDRNLLTTRLRYAGNNGGKWGWKFLFNYKRSRDFPVAKDDLYASDGITKVITPQNFETLGGKRWENIDNIDELPLYDLSFEGGFEFRVNDKTKLNYTASIARMVNNRALPIGYAFFGLQRLEQQVRFLSGNFFGTFYYRDNYGNVNRNGAANNLANYVYNLNYTGGTEGETQTASPQTSEKYFDISLQYRLNVNPDLNFLIGTDFKMSPPYKIEYISGNSSGENAYKIYGGYILGKYKFNDKLNLDAAGRVDYYSVYKQYAFSPRIGLVYNPGENTGIKLSYSRSHEGQSRERSFLDFNFSSLLPPFFPASRIEGVAQPVTYTHPVTRFAFGDVPGGENYSLQDIVNALAGKAGVVAPTVSGTVVPSLTAANFAAPEVGFSTGVPITLDEAGLHPPTLRTVNQVELGLSTAIFQKLQINLDLYNMWIENIQPTGEVPLSAGAQLDVNAIQKLIEQQVPAGPVRDTLIATLMSVPFNPTPNPAFNGTPGYGVVMSDRAQKYGYVFDMGFPTYGNKNVNLIGADLSLTYLLTHDLSVYGN